MDVLMPQLGETVLEGTVTTWYKNIGDSVAKGELLLDVETDKAATEIEAPAEGVLSAINVPAGETVDVGTVVAVIAVSGEAASSSVASGAAAPVVQAQPAGSEPAIAQAAPNTQAAPRGLPAKSTNTKLSPAVRRLAKEHNLDTNAITGTGRDGRVTKRDVMAFLQSPAGSAAGGVVSAASLARPIPSGPSGAMASDEVIPFDRFRRVTAEHMVRSKATSPHVLQAIDADFSQIEASRLPKKDQWKAEQGYSLTYLPFIARAVCQALAEFPRINSSVVGEALHVHSQINLAIAIDLSHEGLVAPVIKNADSLNVRGLASAINDLVVLAKARKLSTDQLSGGTYTLSNPGPYGTLFTAPIINQPQVGILSMDAVKKRPVVIESSAGDSIAIRPVGMLAQSFDHRAIDGAYSAAFLQKLKSLVEETDWTNEI